MMRRIFYCWTPGGGDGVGLISIALEPKKRPSGAASRTLNPSCFRHGISFRAQQRAPVLRRRRRRRRPETTRTSLRISHTSPSTSRLPTTATPTAPATATTTGASSATARPFPLP